MIFQIIGHYTLFNALLDGFFYIAVILSHSVYDKGIVREHLAVIQTGDVQTVIVDVDDLNDQLRLRLVSFGFEHTAQRQSVCLQFVFSVVQHIKLRCRNFDQCGSVEVLSREEALIRP